MLIDSHVHITEDGSWFHTRYDASLERLLGEMEDAGVKRAVLVSLPHLNSSNELVERLASIYPDKFYFCVSADPRQPLIEEQVKKAVLEKGAKGLKLHPRFSNIRLDDHWTINILKLARGLGIPVLVDCFFRDPQETPTLFDEIRHLYQVITPPPLILAHSGGIQIRECFKLAQEFPDIYLDTSYSLLYFAQAELQNEFKEVYRKLGAGRIIFGSDFPEMEIPRSLSRLHEVLSFFSSQEMEGVLGNNLLNLWNKSSKNKCPARRDTPLHLNQRR